MALDCSDRVCNRKGNASSFAVYLVLINLAFPLGVGFGVGEERMLWEKIDLAFLHMHMEMPCRDFTINIDSMSEAPH